MNRIIRVDHTRYKRKDDENADGNDQSGPAYYPGNIENDEALVDRLVTYGDHEIERSLIKEELELAALIRDHDDDDPMKLYLVQGKKEQIAAALATLKDAKASGSEPKSKVHQRHQHHRHKSHRSGDRDEREDDKRHSRRHEGVRRTHKSRSRD